MMTIPNDADEEGGEDEHEDEEGEGEGEDGDEEGDEEPWIFYPLIRVISGPRFLMIISWIIFGLTECIVRIEVSGL